MKSVIAVGVLVGGLVLASKGYGAAMVAALVIALLLAGGVRLAAVGGHAHGGNRARVAQHEAGHVVAARAVGGRVRSARLHSNGGGLVTWDMSARPLAEEVESNLAFLKAGELAAGTTEGCSGDQAAIRRQLRRLPAGERSAAQSRANAKARSIVSSRHGEIRRVADRLNQKGRL
ncbi:MAG TPA: hypothetical protein VIP28_15345 [Nocardioides sp.]